MIRKILHVPAALFRRLWGMSKRLLRSLRQNGLRGTLSRIRLGLKQKRDAGRYRGGIPTEQELQRQRSQNFKNPVRFSILVPLYNTPERYLRAMLDSVLAQTYPHWELCLADGSDAAHNEVETIVKRYCEEDARIRCMRLTENRGISGNTNACAAMAEGDYLILMDHDDLLTPDALYEMAVAIEKTGADVLYSDEDKVTPDGKRETPFYKPDWSPDLLYAQMYICHLLVFRRALFTAIGGFDPQFDGAQDYDLMLRLSEQTQEIHHVPRVLYSWRLAESSTAADAGAKPYAHTAGRLALDGHLKRLYGPNAHADDGDYTFTYDARFDLAQDGPLISLIIPMRDHADYTERCLESIYQKTEGARFEVLVLDNRSQLAESARYLAELPERYPGVRVLAADFDFNWSRLNNFGMQNAKGDVFVFLNNDVEVLTPDWLVRLAENALRPGIGAVGGLLLYPDGTIQHAGVVVGLGGWADHVFKGIRPVHYGSPYVSPVLSRNVLAVTGACMAVSRGTMERIGAFDEHFIVCGSDVELCLRAHKGGLRNLYLPQVRLVHHESKSRDPRAIPQVDFTLSERCYRPYREQGDPYYNRNLDLSSLVPRVR
jgi:GT2 family glycosyltransferase